MKNLSVILVFLLLSFSADKGFAQVPSSTPEQKAVLERLPADVLKYNHTAGPATALLHWM